jgi:Phage capsid protein
MAEDTGLLALYTTQFATNLELLLQQQGTKLRSRVREGFHVGKQASPVNYIDNVAMRPPAGRFAPLNRVDADFRRYWVFPKDGELPQLVDSFDELRTAVDVKSMYVENAVNAAGRYMDDEIIASFTRNATVGQDASGLSAEVFNTAATTAGGYQIPVNFGASVNTGLTIVKLIEARRVFKHYHWEDFGGIEPTLVIGSQQDADLLSQVEFVSTEFRAAPTYDNLGRLSRFMDFDICYSERLLQTTVGSVRGAIAFMKKGVYLGIWRDMANKISQRDDLSSLPWQIYTNLTFGATRLQPGTVIQILCADTSGADITP